MKSKISKTLIALWCSFCLLFSGSLAAHASEPITLQSSTGDMSLTVEESLLSSSSVAPIDESALSVKDDTANAAPMFAGGSVIRVLTSKPACEAMKTFYNTTFPNYPKLKCRKSGKVWVLTR